MQSNAQSGSTISRKIGGALIIFVSVALCGSAVAKLAHIPKVVMQLASMGFAGDRLTLIAVLELVSAGLFVFRSTRVLGLLMVSAFLGGAICTHVQHGELPFQPAFVLGLVWLGMWLRHPNVLRILHANHEHLAPIAQESVVGRP